MSHLAAAPIPPHVRLAPDQPLPYVFGDEPIIVEFLGDEHLDFDVMILYGTGLFPSNSHGLGPIALRAGQPYWTTTNLEPVRFGPYTITLNLQWPTGSQEYDFRLQRIRRPDVSDPLPMMMHIPSLPGPWERICRVLPAQRVSIDSDHPDLERLMTAFTREGLFVRLMLRDGGVSLPPELAPASIAIPAKGSAPAWAQEARRLRAQFASSRVVLERPAPEFLLALLRMGEIDLINAVCVESPASLIENRDVAEYQGYENLAFSVYVNSATRIREAADAWNAGAYVAEVSLDGLWSDDELTAEFGALNALIHLYDRTRIAGRYSEGDIETVLFREIAPDLMGQWKAPLDPSEDLASATQYADENGNLHVQPPPDLAFALGVNTDILLDAISHEIRSEAINLRDRTAGTAVLSDDFRRAIHHLAECDGTQSMRAEFFALLRTLPVLEGAWHGGTLRKSEAVPAIASLERLVLRLAAFEQTLGIPFVEPLEETLDRCAEQQALYLTATVLPGASPERGERLMMHISSLITQARTLHGQGRTIEADAVAALAEWRARSLVHASKARALSEVER